MTLFNAPPAPTSSPLGVLGYTMSPMPATTRSGQLFRSLFERSGIGIAVLDEQCRIQRANADILAMLNRDAAEVEGSVFTDVLDNDNRRELLIGLHAVHTGADRRYSDHVQVAQPDGSSIEADLTAILLHGSGDEPPAVMILLVKAKRNVPEPAPVENKILSEVDARILEGVAAGISTIQLAGQLFLSRQGVEYHVSAMLRRLKAPNRPALISRAYKLGILSAGTWPPRARPEFVH